MPTNYCFGKAGKKQNQVAKNITSKNHAILLTAWKLLKPRYGYTKTAIFIATHIKNSNCYSYKYGKKYFAVL